MATVIEQSIEPDLLNDQLIQARQALYYDLGVPFSGIHLRFNENLSDGMYQILLQEVPVSQGKILLAHVLVRETKESLGILNIQFKDEKPFLLNLPSLWVETAFVLQLERANI